MAASERASETSFECLERPIGSGSSFERLGQVDASILDEIFENKFVKFLKYFKI